MDGKTGEDLGIAGEPGAITEPRLSPDEKAGGLFRASGGKIHSGPRTGKSWSGIFRARFPQHPLTAGVPELLYPALKATGDAALLTSKGLGLLLTPVAQPADEPH